jgi:hypothetical protein
MAQNKRISKPTALNERSSRGHFIMQLEFPVQVILFPVLFIIDKFDIVDKNTFL